jgi:hypothetical protein
MQNHLAVSSHRTTVACAKTQRAPTFRKVLLFGIPHRLLTGCGPPGVFGLHPFYHPDGVPPDLHLVLFNHVRPEVLFLQACAMWNS